QPAVPATPDPAKVCGPALIRPGGYRRQGLNPWAMPHCPLAHLPTLELEDALYRILVHVQQPCHGAIAKGRLLLNQCLDRARQGFLYLRCRLHGTVVEGPSRDFKPTAQLANRHAVAIILQALLHAVDQFSSLPSRASSFFLARSSNM